MRKPKKYAELPKVREDYKDTFFRRLFSEKEALLSLYNAVSGANYTDVDELEKVKIYKRSIQNGIFME